MLDERCLGEPAKLTVWCCGGSEDDLKLTVDSGIGSLLYKDAFELDFSFGIETSKPLVILSVLDATITSFNICVLIGEPSSGGVVRYRSRETPEDKSLLLSVAFDMALLWLRDPSDEEPTGSWCKTDNSAGISCCEIILVAACFPSAVDT